MGRPRGSKNRVEATADKGFPGSAPEIAASSRLVLSLIRASNETKTRMQSEAGALGERIKHAVENSHLHAGALKLVARLARMDEIKRLAFLSALDLYRDYAREGGLFGEEHVGDLVDNAELASAGEAAGKVVENVRRLRGIKPLPDGDPDPPLAA